VSPSEQDSIARKFFMAQLPRHVCQNLEKFAAMAGTIGFCIRSEGKWTVHLGDLESPVTEGMADKADLNMWFSLDAFRDFLDDNLDVAQALESQELEFEGDVSVLERFGSLLVTPSAAGNAQTRFNR
jgi:putative sterol carrier protein